MLFLAYRHSSLLSSKQMKSSFQTNDLCLYYPLTIPSLRHSSLHNIRYGISAGVPQEVAKSIIRLCGNLTQGISRGIPVGPHPTHLLAECVFDPIDRNLLAEGY